MMTHEELDDLIVFTGNGGELDEATIARLDAMIAELNAKEATK